MNQNVYKILIVDDNPDDREACRYYLKQDINTTYEISEESFGEDALETCLQLKPHCIFLDLSLPDMTGLELLEIINKVRQQYKLICAVVFITGTGDEDVAVQAMRQGAQDYLVKNKLSLDILRRSVQGAIQKRIMELELETKQAQIAQRELEFRTLAENSPFVIARFDRELRHTYINSAIEQITGRKSQEFIGKTNAELGMPEDLIELWGQAVNRVFDTGEKTSIEFSFPGPNGHSFFESKMIPELGPDGQVSSVLGITADITSHKNTEQALQELLASEIEASKNKDLFVSVASHELKTPLTVMRGYIQMMERSLAAATAGTTTELLNSQSLEKSVRSLSVILRQVETMNVMINKLLDTSRIENNSFEVNIKSKVNLTQMLTEIVENYRLAYPKRVFAMETQTAEICIICDRLRIEQVVTNLINNAVKYSSEPAPVKVGAFVSDTGDEAVVYIKDEGEGIDPKNHPRLFERFYRVRTEENRSANGLGLGLYISQEILAKHGGRLWLESQLGKGSTFYFSLPLTGNEEAFQTNQVD